MARRNVKQLNEDVEKIEKLLDSALFVSSYTVWNTDQIKKVIDENDRQNEIVQVEINHGFEPGKKSYYVTIFKMKNL